MNLLLKDAMLISITHISQVTLFILSLKVKLDWLNFNLKLKDYDCSTVCGNFNGDSSANTYFPDTSTRQAPLLNFDSLKHNATRTYTSGQWIDIVDYVYISLTIFDNEKSNL